MEEIIITPVPCKHSLEVFRDIQLCKTSRTSNCVRTFFWTRVVNWLCAHALSKIGCDYLFLKKLHTAGPELLIRAQDMYSDSLSCSLKWLAVQQARTSQPPVLVYHDKVLCYWKTKIKKLKSLDQRLLTLGIVKMKSLLSCGWRPNGATGKNSDGIPWSSVSLLVSSMSF